MRVIRIYRWRCTDRAIEPLARHDVRCAKGPSLLAISLIYSGICWQGKNADTPFATVNPEGQASHKCGSFEALPESMVRLIRTFVATLTRLAGNNYGQPCFSPISRLCANPRADAPLNKEGPLSSRMDAFCRGDILHKCHDFDGSSTPQEAHSIGPLPVCAFLGEIAQGSYEAASIRRRDGLFVNKNHSAMLSLFFRPGF